MTRRARGQFQFTVVELVVLAVSFAVTSLLVFLLGFYVGREVAAEHAPLAAEVATLPGDVPALGGPASTPQAGVAGRNETVPAKAPPAGAGAAPAPTPKAASTPRASAPAPRAVPAAPVAKPPAPPAPSSAVRTETEPPPSGTYTVQVLATRNRAEAESMVAGLKRRGYGAFVMAVEDVGGRWYRVRIGRYQDLDSAQSMADRCRRDLGLKRAYVISY